MSLSLSLSVLFLLSVGLLLIFLRRYNTYDYHVGVLFSGRDCNNVWT